MTREEATQWLREDTAVRSFLLEWAKEPSDKVIWLGAEWRDKKVSNSKTIVLDNELALDRVARLAKHDWRQWLLDGKPTLKLDVALHQENRRSAQNRLYWKLVTEIANQLADQMNGEYHTKRTWDEYFKERFLGIESVTFMGRPQHRTKPHKELGVRDFSDYLEQVFVFASENHVLLDANWHEDYSGTMGVEKAA